MLTMFALRRRDPEARAEWHTDVDLAARLGIDRGTVWRWLDGGLIPEPIRVGKVQIYPGRLRSRSTRWRRTDIDLFLDAGSMTEFHRRKKERSRER